MNYHLNYKSSPPEPGDFSPQRLRLLLGQIARAAFDNANTLAGAHPTRGSPAESARYGGRRIEGTAVKIPTHRCGAEALMTAADRQGRQLAAAVRGLEATGGEVRVVLPDLEIVFENGEVCVRVACEAYHR